MPTVNWYEYAQRMAVATHIVRGKGKKSWKHIGYELKAVSVVLPEARRLTQKCPTVFEGGDQLTQRCHAISVCPYCYARDVVGPIYQAVVRASSRLALLYPYIAVSVQQELWPSKLEPQAGPCSDIRAEKHRYLLTQQMPMRSPLAGTKLVRTALIYFAADQCPTLRPTKYFKIEADVAGRNHGHDSQRPLAKAVAYAAAWCPVWLDRNLPKHTVARYSREKTISRMAYGAFRKQEKTRED